MTYIITKMYYKYQCNRRENKNASRKIDQTGQDIKIDTNPSYTIVDKTTIKMDTNPAYAVTKWTMCYACIMKL